MEKNNYMDLADKILNKQELTDKDIFTLTLISAITKIKKVAEDKCNDRRVNSLAYSTKVCR